MLRYLHASAMQSACYIFQTACNPWCGSACCSWYNRYLRMQRMEESFKCFCEYHGCIGLGALAFAQGARIIQSEMPWSLRKVPLPLHKVRLRDSMRDRGKNSVIIYRLPSLPPSHIIEQSFFLFQKKRPGREMGVQTQFLLALFSRYICSADLLHSRRVDIWIGCCHNDIYTYICVYMVGHFDIPSGIEQTFSFIFN